MRVDTDKVVSNATNTISSRSFIPFTGGLIVFIYAWFWPESYGHWLGSIVHAFRTASGI